MKYCPKILFIFFICLFLINFKNFSIAEEDYVRAKILIQIKSGENISRAKSIDRTKKGDLIRIYVYPEKTGHIYVVHTDLKNVTPLNMVQQKFQVSPVVLPSPGGYYEIDGKSLKECFTIIISPNEIPELAELLQTENIFYEKWAELEKRLVEKGKIVLEQDSKKPFSITGNVRSLKTNDDDNNDTDLFVENLRVFSGKSILVKKYEFNVKK